VLFVIVLTLASAGTVEFSAKDRCSSVPLALGLANAIRNVYLAKKVYDYVKAKKEDTEQLNATLQSARDAQRTVRI